jgi:hypothetical protein
VWHRASTSRSPSPSGRCAICAADAVSLSIIKYIEQRHGQKGRYTLEPRTLLPYAPRALHEGVAKRYWLTVHVPVGQAPGIYTGTVAVAVDGAAAAAIPVAVTVLPFSLVADPGIAYGMYYYTPDATVYRRHGRGPLKGAGTWAQQQAVALLAADFADQVAHGMNCSAIEPTWGLFTVKDGTVVADESKWQWHGRIMAAYGASGLSYPLPAYGLYVLGRYLPGFKDQHQWRLGDRFSDMYQDHLRTVVREYYRRVRAHAQWPEPIFYATDELSNSGAHGVDFGRHYLRLLQSIRKDVPGGFRLASSMNGAVEAALLPHLDIAIPNKAFPLDATGVEQIRAAGCEMWSYNLGYHRFTWGYYLLAIKAKGRLQWHYRTGPKGTSDPNNWLTSNSYAMVDTTADGVLPTVAWEAIREGIDDVRYVRTLEAHIARARQDARPRAHAAAVAAQQRLDWILDRINPAIGYYTAEVGFWDAAAFTVLRRRLTDAILMLREALE